MGRFFGQFAGRIVLAAMIAAGCVSGAAASGATGLRALVTGDEGRDWDGVGRLELGDGAFCTGALISEKLVLTAAHCVYDKYSGKLLSPEGIRFLAGLRDGRAAADRSVRRILPHPGFDPNADLMGEIRHDIAVLELDHPIRNGQIAAFDIHGQLTPGRQIGVVSYAHDRSEHPAVQEVCEVIGGRRRLPGHVLRGRFRRLGRAGFRDGERPAGGGLGGLGQGTTGRAERVAGQQCRWPAGRASGAGPLQRRGVSPAPAGGAVKRRARWLGRHRRGKVPAPVGRGGALTPRRSIPI